MKDWTIMVYMAGDNNLSENLAFSLEDIRNAVSLFENGTEKINILTFFDSSSLTAPTYYTDYSSGEPEKHEITKADLYHKRKNTKISVKSNAITREGNSASAYSIMNFVRWCIVTQKKTAHNYALIFSGHSFGFHGTSLLRDENDGGFMTIFKLRWALNEVKNCYLDGKKIGILGFDSCVMSMVEIGYELKDVAETLVASEGSLPNSGWSYAPMLKKMIESYNQNPVNQSDEKSSPGYFNSGQYAKDVATGFVSSFIDQHKNLVVGGRSIDVAAWDLEKVPELATQVNRLGAELNNFFYLPLKVAQETLTDEDIWAFHELKKIILQAHYDTQTYMHEQCIDIKDFCKRLIIELKFIERDGQPTVFSNLKKICKDTIAAVDACVLKSGFCGDEYQFSNGISLYFPWSYLTFELTDFRYRYMLFNRGEGNYTVTSYNTFTGVGKDWYIFLYHYLTRVTMRLARKRKLRKQDKEHVPAIENITGDNPIWSKDTPIWSKDNPFWSRSNPTASRSNPTASRSNPTASRSNPTASRSNPTASRGEMGEYIFYFSRYKNFELRWDVTGYADEFKFNLDFEK
jgi:hypothetical protein